MATDVNVIRYQYHRKSATTHVIRHHLSSRTQENTVLEIRAQNRHIASREDRDANRGNPWDFACKDDARGAPSRQ